MVHLIYVEIQNAEAVVVVISPKQGRKVVRQDYEIDVHYETLKHFSN
jgi:hypothetical protein